MTSQLNLWLYDFEVFQNDWIVTFKNNSTQEIKTFHNDYYELQEFYKNEIEFKSILIGYNNRHYDDWILIAALNNIPLWLMNDWIINQKMNPWEYPALRYKKNTIFSYDLMREIGAGIPIQLKQVEGYLGLKIFESQIPFNLDRQLTEQELKYVIDYNIHDVESTQILFNKYKAKFDAHYNLTETYNLPARSLGHTAPQKTAMILKAQKPVDYHKFNFVLPDKIKHLFNEEDPVLKKFTEYTYSSDPKENEDFNFSYQMQDFEYEFGLGGGHGAIENFVYEGEIWNLDVTSYYVSLMCNFDYVSRNCLNGKEAIVDILNTRIKHKKNGNNQQADALKMILVNIYGAMGFKSNNLYDPQNRLNVCIVGQLLLYYLQRQLEPYAKIIQLNTDGIMLIPYNKNKIVEIYKQWEKDTNLFLELEIGKKIIQKNVNMYIFVKENNDIKAKGNYIRLWNSQMHKDNSKNSANATVNNSLTIIDEAIVKYFVYGIDPEETIKNCNDLIRFQKIIKLQSGYTHLSINNSNGDFVRLLTNNDIYLNDLKNDNIYNGKSYRTFAIKDGIFVKKYKTTIDENGTEIIKNDGIADLSKSVLVYLGDCKNKTPDFIENLDYEWYIKFAKRLINAFLNKEIFPENEISN